MWRCCCFCCCWCCCAATAPLLLPLAQQSLPVCRVLTASHSACLFVHSQGSSFHFDGQTSIAVGQVTSCEWGAGGGQGRFYRESLIATVRGNEAERHEECLRRVQAQCSTCDGALVQRRSSYGAGSSGGSSYTTYATYTCYATSGYDERGASDDTVQSCRFQSAPSEFNGLSMSSSSFSVSSWIYPDEGANTEMIIAEKGLGASDWLVNLRVAGSSSDVSESSSFQVSFAGANIGGIDTSAGVWCLSVDMASRGSTATDATLQQCDSTDLRQFFTYNPQTLSVVTAQDTSEYSATFCLTYFHTTADSACEPLTLRQCNPYEASQKFELEAMLDNDGRVYQWRNRQPSTEGDVQLSIQLSGQTPAVRQYVWACPADAGEGARWQMRTDSISSAGDSTDPTWQLALSSQTDDATFYYDSTVWATTQAFRLENGNAKTPAYSSVLVEQVRITMNNVSTTWQLPEAEQGRFTLRELVLRSPEGAVPAESLQYPTLLGSTTNVWQIPGREGGLVVCGSLAFNADTYAGYSQDGQHARARIGFTMDDETTCAHPGATEGIGLREDHNDEDLGSGRVQWAGSSELFYTAVVEVYGHTPVPPAEPSYRADLASSQLDPVHGQAGSITIPKATWTHVVFVWDGEKRTQFVNGVLAGQDTPTRRAGVESNDPIYIGGRPGSTMSAFVGRMDSFKLFDRALSDSEVSVLARELEILAPCACPHGAVCDDDNDMTMHDMCSAAGECVGIASFGSQLTYNIPAMEELPEADSPEDQELKASIATSLYTVLSAVGMDIAPGDVRVNSVSMSSDAAGRRLQSDAQLVVDYVISVPLDQATPNARTAAIAAMRDPASAGLPADAMAVTVNGQVASVDQVQDIISVTWAKTPVVCDTMCGMPSYAVEDQYSCIADNAEVTLDQCTATIGDAPITDTLCRATLSCRCQASSAVGYSVPEFGAQTGIDGSSLVGLEMGLPDLGLPPLPGSEADIAGTTCDIANNYVGTPAGRLLPYRYSSVGIRQTAP